jgi:hypothetical protein
MRFWAAVDKTDTCWLWTGCTIGNGYGRISRNGESVRAHRAAWELRCGPIPDGLQVLHTCDNPACVRNDDAGWYEVNGVRHPRLGHLWLGTDADNKADMIAKGRNAQGERHGMHMHPECRPCGDRSGVRTHPEKIVRGVDHPAAKLTWEAVREIRASHATGRFTERALARAYGVTQRRVNLIVRGIAWQE